jgi:hypothetical protein
MLRFRRLRFWTTTPDTPSVRMQFDLLKNHEGLLILGATQDFRSFHALLHDVNERSPLIKDKEGMFLGLAYDFRKAFEGRRYIRKPQSGDDFESGVVGFEILWPTLLIQSRMLRESLGYIDTTKLHQVLAYSLEVVIEDGLKLDLPALCPDIHRAYRALDPAHAYLESKASSRIEHWYRWNKKERQAKFVQLLQSLDPMFESDYRYRVKRGEMNLMSPAEWDAVQDESDAPSTQRH